MISVGLGEYAISDDQNETLITYALGSCIAVIIYHPKTKYTAMAHIVLPKGKHESKPGFFAEEMMPKLINFFVIEKKINKDELVIHLIGGATSLNRKDIFMIGEKNLGKISSILKKNGLSATKNDTGGNLSRTVSVCVNDGKITIKEHKMIV